MDGLTFGSTFLLRHLTASESRKLPIREYNYNKILEELQLNKEEFIDLCILMGCDYCESIKGIGPKKALDLIGQYRCIEKIAENLGKHMTSISSYGFFRGRLLLGSYFRQLLRYKTFSSDQFSYANFHIIFYTFFTLFASLFVAIFALKPQLIVFIHQTCTHRRNWIF